MKFLGNSWKVVFCICWLLKVSLLYPNNQTSIEKPFVILIASYNNEKYAEENILSAIKQEYSNYRIIFINDCSSDRTLEKVLDTIKKCRAENRVTVINNQERKLGLRNYYEAIVYHTKDEEIVINLDGDDFLANKNVLKVLNKVYSSQKEVWLTYGQFATLHSKVRGWNAPIPKHVIENNDFRSWGDMPTHLRTFYSWLFKRINLKDLKYGDRFFEMTWDYSFMLPMLEMSGGRFTFINKFLYIYNDSNPINDFRVNKPLQDYYAQYIRGLPKYKPLEHDMFHRCDKGNCILCNADLKEDVYVSR